MQVRKARKPDQLRGKRVPVRLAESIGLDFFAYFFYQEKKWEEDRKLWSRW